MASLADLLNPPTSPELIARLNALDALPDDVEMLLTDLTDVHATLDQIPDLIARLDALTATVARLDKQINPDPYANDTVHVGPATKVSNTEIGWMVVQETEMTPATAAILEDCAHTKGQHAIAFGGIGPMQTAPGGPIDFTQLDKIFGYPNRKDGFFGANCKRVLTAYACPPYMRAPKAGTAPNPTAAPTMGVYDQVPPHWSHHEDWAQFIAACVVRYQLDRVQEWNEDKGEWIGATMPAGAVLVPPGSGLPQAPGGATNRWAIELHTDRFNHVYKAVKAVRPECEVVGPYDVTRTYLDAANPDSANDTFPKDLHGPWGNADWEIMRHVMYHLEHAEGIDAIWLDTKTSTQEGGITPENQWSGLQKILDWQDWLDKLADYDPVKYGRAKNVKIGFAEAYSRLPVALNSTNHQEAVATDAWSIINYVLPSRTSAWMRWQVEGDRKAGVDPASAHSIALWYAKGSAKSLQPTEAVPVYAGLVEHFPPGTQLYSVTADEVHISGIASDTTVCLVSRAAVPVELTFKGEPLVLAPYDVKFVPR